MNIVLQEQAHLFAAEVFADPPKVGKAAQTGLVRGLNN